MNYVIKDGDERVPSNSIVHFSKRLSNGSIASDDHGDGPPINYLFSGYNYFLMTSNGKQISILH